jgi:hypothetical protein
MRGNQILWDRTPCCRSARWERSRYGPSTNWHMWIASLIYLVTLFVEKSPSTSVADAENCTCYIGGSRKTLAVLTHWPWRLKMRVIRINTTHSKGNKLSLPIPPPEKEVSYWFPASCKPRENWPNCVTDAIAFRRRRRSAARNRCNKYAYDYGCYDHILADCIQFNQDLSSGRAERPT